MSSLTPSPSPFGEGVRGETAGEGGGLFLKIPKKTLRKTRTI